MDANKCAYQFRHWVKCWWDLTEPHSLPTGPLEVGDLIAKGHKKGVTITGSVVRKPGLAWCVSLGELPIPLSLSFFFCGMEVDKGVVRSQGGYAFKCMVAQHWYPRCSVSEGH